MAGRKKGAKLTEKELSNLIPLNKRSEAEKKAIIAKGQKAAQEKYARRRTFKEILEVILNSTTEFDGQKTDNQTAIHLAVLKKALKGDVNAISYIRDTYGQKPVEKNELIFEKPLIVNDIPKDK